MITGSFTINELFEQLGLDGSNHAIQNFLHEQAPNSWKCTPVQGGNLG
jgi:hypothetical protein